MGIFDKIIKDAVKEKIEDVIEKATGIDLDGDNEEKTESPQTEAHVENTTTDEVGGHTKEYFLDILKNEFGEYERKENIDPKDIGGIGRNYDFGLYRGGKLVGLLSLIEHNKGNKAFKDSKASAEKAKIPFVHFYLHMRNEKNYVIERIKKAIS